MFNAKDVMGTLTYRLSEGVHGPVNIKDVVLGDKFYEIIYEKGGYIASKRVWLPDPGTLVPKDGQTMEQALANAENRAAGDITLHAKALLSENEFDSLSGKDIKEYVRNARTMIIKNKGKASFNILVEQDGQYTRVARFDYLEVYKEGEPTKLKAKAEAKTDDQAAPSAASLLV